MPGTAQLHEWIWVEKRAWVRTFFLAVLVAASLGVLLMAKPAQRLSLGEFVTATATLRTTGDTSEFSIARKVVLG